MNNRPNRRRTIVHELRHVLTIDSAQKEGVNTKTTKRKNGPEKVGASSTGQAAATGNSNERRLERTTSSSGNHRTALAWRGHGACATLVPPELLIDGRRRKWVRPKTPLSRVSARRRLYLECPPEDVSISSVRPKTSLSRVSFEPPNQHGDGDRRSAPHGARHLSSRLREPRWSNADDWHPACIALRMTASSAAK